MTNREDGPAAALKELPLPRDVSVSRRFGAPGADAPDPEEAKEELSRLFSLSRRYALALYPASGTGIGEIASGLWHPLTLEGFVPHRYPESFHDRGEAGGGDFYLFARRGEPVPEAFSAPGNRHSSGIARSPTAANPEDPEILLKAVKELAAAGETAKAVPLLSRLARMRPEDLRLRLNLGYFHLNQGSRSAAAECFRSALADDPANGEARRALAGIFLSVKDWAGLRAFLPELMLLKASSPKVLQIWPEIRQGFMDLERGA
jgi:tetratricopeptide (TPR) repeat protein